MPSKRAKTPSPRKTFKKMQSRRVKSGTPPSRSTRKRLAKRSRSSVRNKSPVIRPGKAPSNKGKRMPLDEEMKAILLEKTTHLDFRNSFDITGRYTMGSEGNEFTFIPGIDLDKLRSYIQNDEALNDQQFWQDYNQKNSKLSIPPDRKRALKVSSLKNPNEREKKNLYAYVLGCIQEKMHEGYFNKYTNPGEPDPEWGNMSDDGSFEGEGPVNYDTSPESGFYSPTFRDDFYDFDSQWDYDQAISRVNRG